MSIVYLHKLSESTGNNIDLEQISNFFVFILSLIKKRKKEKISKHFRIKGRRRRRKINNKQDEKGNN